MKLMMLALLILTKVLMAQSLSESLQRADTMVLVESVNFMEIVPREVKDDEWWLKFTSSSKAFDEKTKKNFINALTKKDIQIGKKFTRPWASGKLYSIFIYSKKEGKGVCFSYQTTTPNIIKASNAYKEKGEKWAVQSLAAVGEFEITDWQFSALISAAVLELNPRSE